MSTLSVKKERINQSRAGLQEAFIRAAYDSNADVTLTTASHFVTGTIQAMDQFCILIDNKLVFKSAIDTIELSDNNPKQEEFLALLTKYMDQYIPNRNGNKPKKPSHNITKRVRPNR